MTYLTNLMHGLGDLLLFAMEAFYVYFIIAVFLEEFGIIKDKSDV